MADETFSTQLELDLDTRKALAQLAALNRKIRAIFGPSILGPIGGGVGGRGIGVSAGEKRKARADQLLATNTELAAARMAKAAAALNIPGRGPGTGRGPTNFASYGRNIRRGFDSAAQNTRTASLLGLGAGVGSLYAYGRFQSQSIGLAAPIVGASKGSIGFRQALELSRKQYIPTLDKFAARTPFTLGGDIIPAATTGMNFGLQQKNTPESVAEMVRMLGNMQVATGNRRSMADLGVILGKGASRGEFAGEEMLQLAEAGINIEEIMREIGGKSFKDFQKGGLAAVYGTDADKMLEAIRTIYLDANKKGGLVKELSTTLPGATSTFADAVDRFGRNVGKSAEDRYNVSGKILGGADILNDAPKWVVDSFAPAAAAAAALSTALKALGVSVQGALLLIAGGYATKKFANSLGLSVLTGGIIDEKKHYQAMIKPSTAAQRIGRTALTASRHLIYGGVGALAGSAIGTNLAPEGYEGYGGLVGGIAGAGLGSGLLNMLTDQSHKDTDSPKNYVKLFGRALAGLSPKLVILAGAAGAAAGTLTLLEKAAESNFQSGQGLSAIDDVALWLQSNVLRRSDDTFRQGDDIVGPKLQVILEDRRSLVKYENRNTNEIIAVPGTIEYGGVSP